MKRGPLFEAQVVAYLRDHGFPDARRPDRNTAAENNKGDIFNVPGIVLELKNRKTMALAEWVDEAEQEAGNAGCEVFCCVHKRRGKGDAGESYVTLPLRVFVELVK